LLISPDFGATRWGRKIKKNPDNNKNNADRQRFQGGFVIANPPFDYLASTKAEHLPETPPETTLLPAIPAKRVQFLRKPLKSPFLRLANTEFHA
jgi:hypothetical protein|tara:strand:+ start:6372 stop:6653 length:282 start_codon:yes stop_codon:yes gene_type:complete